MKKLIVLVAFLGLALPCLSKADAAYYTYRSADSWTSSCYAADANGNPLSGGQAVDSSLCIHGFAFLWNASASQALCYAVDAFGYAANRMNDTVYDNIYCINSPSVSTSPMLK